MTVEIREAVSDDVPELSALATRTWLDAFGASVAAEDAAAEVSEERSEDRFHRALESRTILVAVKDGSLVGYTELGDDEVHRLYVETNLHGGGIGRALLDAALAHPRLAAAPRVRLQVWEENERAVRLYERAGFRRIGTTRFAIGQEVVEDAVYVLER